MVIHGPGQHFLFSIHHGGKCPSGLVKAVAEVFPFHQDAILALPYLADAALQRGELPGLGGKNELVKAGNPAGLGEAAGISLHIAQPQGQVAPVTFR